MSPHVELVEMDRRINDPAFADAAADMLLRFFAERLRKATRRILGLSLGALLSRPSIEALRPAGSRHESMRRG